MTRDTPPAPRLIAPGATLGVLGGGQLGRMIALAARPLGYRVHVLDPDPNCAASAVVDRVVAGGFDDARAAAELAAGVDVVTLEIEQLGADALAACAARAPLRPSASVVGVVQDRVRQKRWLGRHGAPLGAWSEAGDEASFVAAWRAHGGRVFAKSAFGGYDGRGQARGDDTSEDAARRAFAVLPAGPCVVEAALELAAELSVLVARDPTGHAVAYPAARNHHERQALDWSVIPGGFAPAIEARAQGIALAIARELDVIGLLCVEFFLTRAGELLVNELAPRPHNSYHASPAACVTGQFEQLVRAVTGLPLGAVTARQPAAIANLFGDLWQGGEPAFARALAVLGVTLVLYGKPGPRPGRKMGHLLAVGDTPEEARERVLKAREALASDGRNSF